MDHEMSVLQALLSGIWPEWRITKRLGKGTYGAVYEIIRDDLGTQYKCAMKVLQMEAEETKTDNVQPTTLLNGTKTFDEYRNHPVNCEESPLEDFVCSVSREIDMMMQLKGAPHIVLIEDYAVIREPGRRTILIRMEALESLDKYVQRTGLMKPEDILHMGMDICKALIFCEQRNILHRDIKPSNLFYSDKAGYKLGDFGISRTMESIHERMTMSGIGTIQYMAPEVYFGHKYNNTVDIYSLGVVLYILFNEGYPPLCPVEAIEHGRRLTASELHEANIRRLKGELLPPPIHADSQLAAVIGMACHQDPVRRFQTAQAFFQALQNCLNEPEGRQTAAYPPIDRQVPEYQGNSVGESGWSEIRERSGQSRVKNTEYRSGSIRWNRILPIFISAALILAAAIGILLLRVGDGQQKTLGYQDVRTTADSPVAKPSSELSENLLEEEPHEKESIEEEPIEEEPFTEDPIAEDPLTESSLTEDSLTEEPHSEARRPDEHLPADIHDTDGADPDGADPELEKPAVQEESDVLTQEKVPDIDYNTNGQVRILNKKYAQKTAFDRLAVRFENETGIQVTVETPGANGYSNALEDNLTGSSKDPTLFMLSGRKDFDKYGFECMDLTDCDPASELISDEYTLRGSNGKIYGLACIVEAYGLTVNTRLLQKAGYALSDIQSFDDLKTIVEDITDRKEELGFAAFTSPSIGAENSGYYRFAEHAPTVPLYYELKDNDFNIGVKLQGTYLDCFKKYIDLYLDNATVPRREAVSRSLSDAQEEFLLEKAVFHQDGSWNADVLESALRDHAAVIPLYMDMPGEEAQGINETYTSYWCVNKYASEDDIEATLQFLQWLVTSEEGIGIMTQDMGFQIPYRRADIPDNLYLKTLHREIDDGKTPLGQYYKYGRYDTWTNGLNNALKAYVDGTGSWDDVCKAFIKLW